VGVLEVGEEEGVDPPDSAVQGILERRRLLEGRRVVDRGRQRGLGSGLQSQSAGPGEVGVVRALHRRQRVGPPVEWRHIQEGLHVRRYTLRGLLTRHTPHDEDGPQHRRQQALPQTGPRIPAQHQGQSHARKQN